MLCGVVKFGRVFIEWIDKYLKENFVDLEVWLEGKKEKSFKVLIGVKGVGRDIIGELRSLYFLFINFKILRNI